MKLRKINFRLLPSSKDLSNFTLLFCRGRLKAMLHEQFFLQLATRQTLRCKLQEKKFTCDTPFCNCNCCVASCKKSRTTLYFSQRFETGCLRVTSPLQLERFFYSSSLRCKLQEKLPRVTWPQKTYVFVAVVFFLSSLIQLPTARLIS